MGVKANLPEKMVQDVRGGTRGGRDQFSWPTVKADKHRASYLGNSVKVPHGRWAEEKDVFWYAKEKTIGFTKGEKEGEERKRREEIVEIKKKERELMDEVILSGTVKKKEEPDIQSPPRHQTRYNPQPSRQHTVPSVAKNEPSQERRYCDASSVSKRSHMDHPSRQAHHRESSKLKNERRHSKSPVSRPSPPPYHRSGRTTHQLDDRDQ